MHPAAVYGNAIIGFSGSSFFVAGEYFFFTGKVLAGHISLIPRVNSRCVCLSCAFVYFLYRVSILDVYVSRVSSCIFYTACQFYMCVSWVCLPLFIFWRHIILCGCPK